MHEARFTVEEMQGIPVVVAAGEIDITNATDLRAALLEESAAGAGTLVVDLTQTLFCDSAGLHALVAANKRAQAAGRQELLVMHGAAVLRIFAITGLDREIPHFTSLEQAMTQASAAPSADPGSPAG